MKSQIVYILFISCFPTPIVIEGFHSKEACERTYAQLSYEDLKTSTGEGWNKTPPEFGIYEHEHMCVGVVK